MDDTLPHVRCQRCGSQMELKDPGPGMAWPPEQVLGVPDVRPALLVDLPPARQQGQGRRVVMAA